MIKFFRKIRQRLLTQNKLGSYIVYAFGEIILVVIGILIALGINNKNQQRVNELRIENILKEIQSDLLSDIEQASLSFDHYVVTDSIQNLILNSQYTAQDFHSGDANELGNFYHNFLVERNGYENFMRNIDNVPERYEILISDLKTLYVSINADIEVYNKRIQETVYNNIDHKFNLDWYSKSLQGIITDEEIDFFMTSKYYKSTVIKFINDRENLFLQSQMFRFFAIKVFNKINAVLPVGQQLPELSNSLINEKKMDELVGVFRCISNANPNFDQQVELYKDDNELYLKSNNENFLLRRHKGNKYYVLGQVFYLNFSKYNPNDLFLSFGLQGNAVYEKQ